jgi:hypothetical protein
MEACFDTFYTVISKKYHASRSRHPTHDKSPKVRSKENRLQHEKKKAMTFPPSMLLLAAISLCASSCITSNPIYTQLVDHYHDEDISDPVTGNEVPVPVPISLYRM